MKSATLKWRNWRSKKCCCWVEWRKEKKRKKWNVERGPLSESWSKQVYRVLCVLICLYFTLRTLFLSHTLINEIKRRKIEEKKLSFLIKIIQIFVSILEISCFLHLVEVYWFHIFIFFCVSSTKKSLVFMTWPILFNRVGWQAWIFENLNRILNFKNWAKTRFKVLVAIFLHIL